jgi:hypothetical protein
MNYDWNSDINDWDGDYKYEYSYDSSGREILTVNYDWNSDIRDWEGDYKLENIYDANGYIVLSMNYRWNSTINDWKLSEKDYYFYSKINTKLNDLAVSELLVYPNPAIEYINIRSDKNTVNITFELFDMQGRKVLYTENPDGKKIRLKGIIPGLYLYNIIVNGALQSGKLIKE